MDTPKALISDEVLLRVLHVLFQDFFFFCVCVCVLWCAVTVCLCAAQVVESVVRGSAIVPVLLTVHIEEWKEPSITASASL